MENADSPARLFLVKRIPISAHNIFLAEDDALDDLLSKIQVKRGLPITVDDKRAIPMSGGIYGKRSVPLTEEEYEFKRSSIPFSGGIYGKRSMNIPFSGGIYGKRSIALRSLPISGGIYG